MSEEYIFAPCDTTLDNVAVLSEEQLILAERRICENYDVADSAARFALGLLREGMNIYEVLSLISEGLPSYEGKIHSDALADNIEHLGDYLSALEVFDRVSFVKMFSKRFADFGHTLTESDFLPAVGASQSFVYVKNPYADEAYDVFSQEFSDPRVSYAKGFKEALSTVASGDATYCLLPIEEKGTRLPTVAELLYKGDFKINSVIPVLGFDGLADMKYALVSKGFSTFEVTPDDDRYLEIRIEADGETDLCDIISAARYHSLAIYRINTVRFDTDDGPRMYYSIVFRGEGADFSAILTYLTVFSNMYTPVGLYKNLE